MRTVSQKRRREGLKNIAARETVTPPISVLHVISNLKVGGAQEALRTLVGAQVAKGCRPVICTFEDGPLRSPIKSIGVPVEVVPGRAASVVMLPLFLADMWRLHRSLLRLIDKYNVDIVQTHLLRVLDFVVLSLRIRRRIRVCWTIQNSRFTLREEHLQQQKWLLRPKRWAHRCLYRVMSRWVDGIVAVSSEVKTSILREMGRDGSKVRVIENSVNVDRYRLRSDRPRIRSEVRRQIGIPKDDPVMIAVATFKRQKGHHYLLEAAVPVVHRFSRLRILLVGDGDLRETLVEQSNQLGLQENVHFLGTRHDIPDLLAASDYFVLPSLWEGLSVALLEAMASGLPIIATTVSGTKQVMIHGESGWLVAPGRSHELEKAMLHLLSNPALCRSMGVAAQRRVEELFGAEKCAAEHVALYRMNGCRDRSQLETSDFTEP